MNNIYCPCCLKKEIRKKFISYNNVKYSICYNCNTSYQNPPLKIEYSEQGWGKIIDPDNNVRDMRKERNFKIKNWYGETISNINKLNGGNILDIGCGLGFFLSAIDSKWNKYGLETSNQSINFIKENFKDINIYHGTIEENDLKNDLRFDVIFFYHVIEHLHNPLQALDKIKKMLKTGGLLILGTPNNTSICARIFGKNYRMLSPGHVFLTSYKQMKKILLEKDFSIEKEEFPFFKTDYFTFSNFLRLFLINKISPPFYGNLMTFYARKNK